VHAGRTKIHWPGLLVQGGVRDRILLERRVLRFPLRGGLYGLQHRDERRTLRAGARFIPAGHPRSVQDGSAHVLQRGWRRHVRWFGEVPEVQRFDDLRAGDEVRK
jgi:hypothetical protein